MIEKSKNLSATEQNQTVAGEIGKTEQDIKGKILEFGVHMTNDGLSPKTVESYTFLLTKLAHFSDLLNPESVKAAIVKMNSPQNTKATMKGAYGSFVKFLGLTWKAPKIEYQQKVPFIPCEKEIDDLIAGSGRKTSILLQLLKETGMRIGEALRLKWIDINSENNTITLNEPEKHGVSRMFRATPKLIGTLNGLPKKTERIFGKATVQHQLNTLQYNRIKLARKLGNPRLLRITFHTLRHWKGTMEYHRTHDPWHVKQLLGHRSLKSTEIYINVEQAIFNDSNSEFHVAVTSTLKETAMLLEQGFEYIMDYGDKKLLRKRK